MINMNDIDLNHIWISQNGDTCHTVNETVDVLQTSFGDIAFSRNGLVNRPSRSWDLMLLC